MHSTVEGKNSCNPSLVLYVIVASVSAWQPPPALTGQDLRRQFISWSISTCGCCHADTDATVTYSIRLGLKLSPALHDADDVEAVIPFHQYPSCSRSKRACRQNVEHFFVPHRQLVVWSMCDQQSNQCAKASLFEQAAEWCGNCTVAGGLEAFSAFCSSIFPVKTCLLPLQLYKQ